MSEKELAEKRISEIEAILEDVEIIEHQAGGQVRYGSTVVVEDEKGRQSEYTIVGTGEVDILKGTISLQSPVGKAIQGKSKGDKALVNAPNKKYELKVVEVR